MTQTQFRDDAEPPMAQVALSCLMDGELDANAGRPCIEGLCADQEARRAWALWHVASDALRSSEVAALHSQRFCDRLHVALEAEPRLLAPRAFARARSLRRVVLPGAAVAAAVAALVVVALPQLQQPSVAPQAAGATTPVGPAVIALPVAGEVARSAELEAYLVAHREAFASGVMPRSTAYLRTSVGANPEGR